MDREAGGDTVGRRPGHRVGGSRDITCRIDARHRRHPLGVGPNDWPERCVVQLAAEVLRDWAVEVRAWANVERIERQRFAVIELDRRQLRAIAVQRSYWRTLDLDATLH